MRTTTCTTNYGTRRDLRGGAADGSARPGRGVREGRRGGLFPRQGASSRFASESPRLYPASWWVATLGVSRLRNRTDRTELGVHRPPAWNVCGSWQRDLATLAVVGRDESARPANECWPCTVTLRTKVDTGVDGMTATTSGPRISPPGTADRVLFAGPRPGGRRRARSWGLVGPNGAASRRWLRHARRVGPGRGRPRLSLSPADRGRSATCRRSPRPGRRRRERCAWKFPRPPETGSRRGRSGRPRRCGARHWRSNCPGLDERPMPRRWTAGLALGGGGPGRARRRRGRRRRP